MFEGAAEIGPRALGHRSIMARPDFPELRRRVSETIKRREWYRPVAPVVREDLAEQAFGRSAASSPLARYMLGAFRVQASWGPAFAGVLHADGTARLQVVSSRDPELTFLHALLGELWDRHRIAGLINTSFNGPGEPIVHSQQDALDCARRLQLDGVVVNGSLHRR